MKKIVAIDFDDTITEYRPYPQVAPLNQKAKKYLIKIHDLGYELDRIHLSYIEYNF